MHASLREIALLFLRLGGTSFGGPAAHIAMMEDEVVKRRGWLSHDHFLDLVSATNLIPGPNSTELAIHIGYLRAGWKGLVLAGLCFVLPAVLITLTLAVLYVEYHTVPQLGPAISGIRAAVIAVIGAAVIRLSKPVVRRRFSLVVGLAVLAGALWGANELGLLLGAGVLGLLWGARTSWRSRIGSVVPLLPLSLAGSLSPVVAANSAAVPATLWGLGLFFLKIGSVLYGSGYVLIAFLQGGLVEARHWLTQSQLLDAIAVGQFTPGPVLSTATFIGYLILGIPGAAISTAGIFLPSFVLVAVTGPLLLKLRRSPLARDFLDAVNAASLALMAAVVFTLSVASLTSVIAWAIFVLAAVILVTRNWNAAWIVLAGGLVGWIWL
jgi:chromate transporter